MPTAERRAWTPSASPSSRQERDNLYKLWNRMSLGELLPGPVRAVEIPKDHGAGVRILGVPNTADRIAQTAAAKLLEEKLEPIFHPDSYGYRPGRSAHDALAVTRKRCWKTGLDCSTLTSGPSSTAFPMICCSKRSLTTPTNGGSCCTSNGG